MPDYRKLFLLIFAIGIAVRIFVALMLPDTALSDTIYHLVIARHVAQTGYFPFSGIQGIYGINEVPPPIFHTFIAVNAVLTGIAVNSQTALLLKLLVSIGQLLVAFVLLRRLFPQKWPYGMAFFTMMPLLTKYAGVSYVETLASVFVLLSFYLFVLFRETGHRKFLLISAFSLAAMAISKLNATILLPGFLLLFILECRRKGLGKKTMLIFLLLSLLLSSAWFIADFMRYGKFFSSNAMEVENLLEYSQNGFAYASISKFFGFVVEFNESFWDFPTEAVLSRRDVLSMVPVIGMLTPLHFILLLDLLTIPVLLFVGFSIANSARKRQPYSLPLLLIYALAFIVVLARSGKFVFARMFLPAMPLLAISFTQGMDYLSGNWKKIFVILVAIAAAYSFLNMSFVALYYNIGYQETAGLYNEISKTPPNSRIIISGNYARAVTWLAERDAIGPEGAFNIPKTDNPLPIIQMLSEDEIYSRLKALGVTHLALVCLDDSWNRDTISKMEQAGMLEQLFREDCAVLYGVK